MKRTKRALLRYIRDGIASLFGFEVIAVWDDRLFNHWALNEKEAQEWADQYLGTSARVRVWAGNQQATTR